MDSRESLIALRERVAGLKGPDREVDALVCERFDLPACEEPDCFPDVLRRIIERVKRTHDADSDVPSYTASVDAVLSLIERVAKGWSWGLCGGNGSSISYAEVYVLNEAAKADHPLADADGHSPALALLEALLSALIVSESMALTSEGQTHG